MEEEKITPTFILTRSKYLQRVKRFLFDELEIPTLSHHNQEEREFRKKIGKYLSNQIGKTNFGLTSPIKSIKRLSGGQVGFVVKLTLKNGETYVFKTALDGLKIQNEEQYYLILGELELDTLEVKNSGPIENTYYIIDKFIQSESFDTDNKETMQMTMNNLGKYIATIHQETLNRYYKDTEGVIRKKTEENQITRETNIYGQETVQFIEDRSEFTDKEKKKVQNVVKSITSIKESCLTHNDLGGTNNIFKVSNKIIPFDPNADISHPYTDIAKFFGNNNNRSQRESFLSGYREVVGDIDESLLQKFVLIGLIKKYRIKLLRNKNTYAILEEVKSRIATLS